MSRLKEILKQTTVKESIFNPLNVKYYFPYFKDMGKYIINMVQIYPKLYQIIDLFSIHYFPLEKVLNNIKEENSNGWNEIIKEYISSSFYKDINELTRDSYELTLIASIKFMEALLQNIKNKLNTNKTNVNTVIENLSKNEIEKIIPIIRRNVIENVTKYKQLQNTISCVCNAIGSGGQGFSHFGLSLIHLINNEYKYEHILTKLSTFLQYLKKFQKLIPQYTTKIQQSSRFGTISGLRLMLGIEEFKDVIPFQLIFPKPLLAIRLITNTLQVRDKVLGCEFVVYVDKSGSMDDYMMLDGKPYPKISIATAFATALYLTHRSKIYLFDTEIHEVDKKDIIKILLHLKATGGTKISTVLEHIKEHGKNKYNIVISDGIDNVPENLAKEVAKTCHVVFLIIPPTRYYTWLNYFKYSILNEEKDFLKAFS